MIIYLSSEQNLTVALYTSAWIEILNPAKFGGLSYVALYTSAWIEMDVLPEVLQGLFRRTLHECVD